VLNRLTAALVVLLLHAGLGGSARAADAKVDAKADPEAAAAMDRAKRQAASPLRVILEASKVRRKVGSETDLAPAAISVDAAATRRVAARVPAAPAELPTAMRTLSLAPAAARASTEGGKAMAVSEPAPASEALSVLTASTAPVAALPDASLRPKLVDMVEPVIPQRLLDDIGRSVEVTVDVTIRADGSVAGVAVMQPAPRTLVRYIVAAVERWRFEPLPGERVHRVQLVIN
jgi:Meckel syndrome type 1 protein